MLFTDPLLQTQGYEQLAGYINALHKNVPAYIL